MNDQRLQMVASGLMTVGQVSEFLNLARSTIYALMDQGTLPYVRIGRARRIPRRAVLELAAANLSGTRTEMNDDRR